MKTNRLFYHSSLSFGLFPSFLLAFFLVCFSYHAFVYTPFCSLLLHFTLSFICSFSFVLSIISSSFFLPHKLYPAFSRTNCVVKHLCRVFGPRVHQGQCVCMCVSERLMCSAVRAALLCMLVRRGSLCVLVFKSFLFKTPDNGLVIEENSRLTMSLCVW